MIKNKFPILYSFRRCPYAMRARLALQSSGIIVEIREIKLQNKPKEFIQSSQKGTVPVLILNSEKVLDESIDIIKWALKTNDPKNWLAEGQLNQIEIDKILITLECDFKKNLDRYKYPNRYAKIRAAIKNKTKPIAVTVCFKDCSLMMASFFSKAALCNSLSFKRSCNSFSRCSPTNFCCITSIC